MNNEFEVSVNEKVVKLQGYFVGNKFCVDLSNVDKQSALT